MGFLGKLTGGRVDWTLRLETPAAAFRPGDTVRGAVGLTPQRDTDARALVVSLIGTETYRYVEHVRSGSHAGTERREASSEVFRQDTPLGGPTRFAAGQGTLVPFQIVIPSTAPPTFQSGSLSCSWRLEVKLDVGGRDPSTDQALTVLQPAARLASVGGPAVAPRADGTQDGAPYAVWLEPAPLLLGAPFHGAVDLQRLLEGDDVRMELNVEVEAGGGFGTGTSIAVAAVLGSGRDNVNETITVWRGGIAPATAGAAGWYRYTFAGTLPSQLVPTIELPHGHARARLQLVVSRRLLPDTRYGREVALATVW